MPAVSIIDTRAHIETPENVQLTFRLAGPGTRLGAYMLDFALRLGVLYALALASGILAPITGSSGLSLGLLLIGWFVLDWFYGSLFEGLWSGRTPGKWVTGLRVIKEEGYPISFYDAVLRNLLRAADILPILYGAGLLVMMATRRMQRMGDLIAGTIVVREQREALREDLPLVRAVPPIPRSLLRHSYRPSDRTLDLIERLFLRRAGLTQARVDEIASVLARPLAQRLGYEDAAQEDARVPSRFLLRVLRTFSHVSTELRDAAEDSQPIPAEADDAPLATPIAWQEPE